MKTMKTLLVILSFAFIISACGNKKSKESDSKKVSITAAGATFPLPFYNLAFKSYTKKYGTLVTYGGIGSGGGIRSLKDKIVDFGASDAFLSDEKIKDMPYSVVHIPTCMGAVVVAYNLEGITQIKLTPEILSDIFLGKITKWNDKRIVANNKEIKLPDLDITVVYRSDGSGTTFVFSDYLSKISNEWKEKVGSGKSLKWPTGLAAKGNPGVAGTISQTKGAIGYVGSEYAFSLKIPVAKLQNKAGNYVEPSLESISAAASGEIPADTRVMCTNSDAVDAYPISCFTWILVYKDQAYEGRSKDQGKETVKLLDWMLSEEAQALTKKVHYAPLPKKAVENAQKIVRSISYEGNQLLK